MKKFNYLLFLVLAMIVFIFSRSLRPADVSATESKLALSLLQSLVPFALTEHFIRKLAHFTEFAVLGILAGLMFGERCRHLWSGLLFAVMTGIVTALCDETIQLFVDGRTGQIPDIWIDIAGAAAGAVLALSVRALWRRKD